jgi:hypothetical protein
MKKLILAALLLAIAGPAFACEWTKSVSSPTPTRDSVATGAPQTPIPPAPKG